jgi:hypothetical protein
VGKNEPADSGVGKISWLAVDVINNEHQSDQERWIRAGHIGDAIDWGRQLEPVKASARKLTINNSILLFGTSIQC